MTQRTCNIIRACKGSLYPEIENRMDRIKAYMADECGCLVTDYTDDVMESIIRNAVYDYIDTCDKPSTFLRLANECIEKNLNITERFCVAFTLVQVRSGGEYVNGFKKEFFN